MAIRFEEGLPQRIMVVKCGTKNLLDPLAFTDYANQIVEIWNGMDIGVVVVSSGAIYQGWNRMNELGENSPFLEQEELAGIGSRHLLNAWGDAFELEDKKEVGQVWVTDTNLNDEREGKSIKKRILNYLKAGVIPIINENDVVSNKEIEWMEQGISENDRLARKIAELIGADEILFLTDVGGVYEDNPNLNHQARMYKELTPADASSISTTQSDILGKGGMKAKLEEAVQCFNAGMRVAIAGNEKDAILKFARRESVGTAIGTTTKFKKMEE